MSSGSVIPLLDRGGYVVLERSGGLWGVAGRDVRHLRRDGERMLLEVEGGFLDAEEVLAVVPDLTVRPAPAVVGRFWPEAAAGLAVYRQRPVLVIDALRPPRMLLAEGGERESDEGAVEDLQSQGTGGNGDAGAGD